MDNIWEEVNSIPEKNSPEEIQDYLGKGVVKKRS